MSSLDVESSSAQAQLEEDKFAKIQAGNRRLPKRQPSRGSSRYQDSILSTTPTRRDYLEHETVGQ